MDKSKGRKSKRTIVRRLAKRDVDRRRVQRLFEQRDTSNGLENGKRQSVLELAPRRV